MGAIEGDVPDHQQSANDKADERQQDGRLVKGSQGHLRAFIGNDDPAVLQADKGDKEADAASDGGL